MSCLTRRVFLGSAAATLATLAGYRATPRPSVAAASPGRRRVCRIAHLTDTHTQPERRAAEGLAQCLAHVSAHRDPPDMIISGGDLIMDGFDQDEARTRLQWELFTKVMRDHAGLPVRHCLGNHDVWGWNKTKSRTTGAERLWGKAWACDVLGLERPFFAFDAPARNGQQPWRVVVLDSTFPDGEGYIACFTDEQHDFLAGELAALAPDRHAMVVSHMPILMTSALLSDRGEITRDRRPPASWTHIDAKKLVNLFDRTPAVKACVSGHMHEIDRIEYQGVAYLCNGAVSGNWWKGRHRRCDEGYALLDLYDDGSIERTYTTFGWLAQS